MIKNCKKSILAVSLTAAISGLCVAGTQSVDRDEVLQAIEQYNSAQQQYMSDLRSAGKNATPEETKQKLAKLKRPELDSKLLQKARQVYLNGPYDDSAFQTLLFVRMNAPFEGEGSSLRDEAMEVMLNHYADREDIMSHLGYVVGDLDSKLSVYDRIYQANSNHSVKAKAAMEKLGVLTAEIGKPMPMDKREALAKQAMVAVNLIKSNYAAETGKNYRGQEYTFDQRADELTAEIQSHLKAEKLQNIQLVDLDGQSDELSNYRGKFVLVDFWATWCGPCKAGMPGLVKLKESLDGKPFEIISISVDEDPESVVEYQEEEQPMPWVNWHSGPDHPLLKDLEIKGFPTYILLDQEGHILARTHYLDDASKEYTKQLVKAAK